MFNNKPKDQSLGEILEVFESAAVKLESFVETKIVEEESIEAKLSRVKSDRTKGESVLAKFKDLLA